MRLASQDSFLPDLTTETNDIIFGDHKYPKCSSLKQEKNIVLKVKIGPSISHSKEIALL